MRNHVLLAFCLGLPACATLHKTQLSDIDTRKGRKVSVKVSETTLDLQEMADLAKLAGSGFKSPAASNLGKGLETYTMR